MEDLWIRYRATFERSPTVRESLRHFGRRRAVRVIEAVKGISLAVRAGRVLGVIGANGAGKSTLLRAIAGILPPDEGRIMVRGRVSTLLALGVGFNKNLSGRENVILGGLAAGLDPDDVRVNYKEIVSFAELGDFIDLPMRTYSSGMYGRLAFAVAAFMNPDILLIDEALSAGDAAFKKKSLEKMRQLCDQARTIVIVSHGLGTIQELASDCIWLHEGRIRKQGNPKDVIDEYVRFTKTGDVPSSHEDV